MKFLILSAILSVVSTSSHHANAEASASAQSSSGSTESGDSSASASSKASASSSGGKSGASANAGAYASAGGRSYYLVDSCDDPLDPDCHYYDFSTSVNAAVLFEETEFKGIKHWIDGKAGECRGLSGVPVKSTKTVARPGDDPVTGEVKNDISMVFYTEWGCKGNVIGTVVGTNKDTTQLLKSSPKSVMFTNANVVKANEVKSGNNTAGSNVKNDASVGSTPSLLMIFLPALLI